MINVVPTYDDVIDFDCVSCPTFQLVWNDFVSFFEGSIYFDEVNDFILNLNKKLFDESMICDDYYFKIYGLKNYDLKLRIEKGIFEKFGVKSDILDDIDFFSKGLNYLFYSMLYRKFRYERRFEVLDNGRFGKSDNVRFFGFNDGLMYRDQVDVLFYNADSYGIRIKALSDEILLYKNPLGDSFGKIYGNLMDLTNGYSGDRNIVDGDKLRVPFIDFSVKREYFELENVVLIAPFNRRIMIDKALQSISLVLSDEGGVVKSEASMGVKVLAFDYHNMRRFYFDDTFALFIKERDKNVPYFSALINDISKFQGCRYENS